MTHQDHDHPDIGCLEAIEGLYALLDGELSDASAARRIEAHIAHCRSCFSRAEIEKVITQRIRDLHRGTPDATAPERLHRRLQKLLEDL